MKHQQSILFVFFLVVVPFIGVESSPTSSLNENFTSNITRGSYLSTSPNNTGYWLSPSGNIAFGFYKLQCSKQRSHNTSSSDRYVVGIWFVKSAQKNLVWTNRNNLQFGKPSSILLTSQGKLVLQVDNKEESLIPDLPQPISYAKMHDNGNFVLYGSDSHIIWESFDYPTDTILGGQKLKDGADLVSSISDMFNPGSGEYKLSIRQTDGLVAVQKFSDHEYLQVISDGIAGSLMSPVTLNLDNNTGNLFLVDSDDVVVGKLYEDKNQQPRQEQHEVHIYRATLNSKGVFNLFKERIDGNYNVTDKSSVLLLWSSNHKESNLVTYIIIGSICAIGVYPAVVIFLVCCGRMKKRINDIWENSGGDLESGRY